MKNIVEFGLNTRIHPVSIIFKDEATNDIRIHLGSQPSVAFSAPFGAIHAQLW